MNFPIILLLMFSLAVRSPSRHSARATANVTTGKKSMGSREKTSDDKSNLKQQTPSASDIQGNLSNTINDV